MEELVVVECIDQATTRPSSMEEFVEFRREKRETVACGDVRETWAS